MGEIHNKLMSAKVSDLVLGSAAHACAPETSVEEVVARLRRAEIGCIVVVKERVPVGVFSERDYIKKIACNKIDKRSPVSTFMTPNPVCVGVHDPISKILVKMRMGRFRHIIVTDENGLLKNVISVKDVLDHLLDAVSAG